MARSGKSRASGKSHHVYFEKDQDALLEAIATAMGKPRTGIEPSRSQLIGKAIENFMEECRREPVLRGAIEETERRLLAENRREEERTKARGGRRGLEVVLPGA
jgi:hypothetical protein